MCLKRALDFGIAAIVLLCLSPVLVLVACAIRWSIGRPILFRQERIGLHERSFTMYKFRTMSLATDGCGVLLPDEVRLTKAGRFVRSASLDELPQLWHVLTGEMSLVGPRPLLPEYLPLYSPTQRRRHEVLPGITGWAQVNGRNALTWDRRFEMDVWYADHHSIGLDLKILVLTAWKVIRRQGICREGHVSMPAFTGTAQEEA
ncbi:MAG TPA: sugar transferase [Bryobacteraceae bacterium]|nr:sugar transferase [Bryobacteraceae bacterium]